MTTRTIKWKDKRDRLKKEWINFDSYVDKLEQEHEELKVKYQELENEKDLLSIQLKVHEIYAKWK